MRTIETPTPRKVFPDMREIALNALLDPDEVEESLALSTIPEGVDPSTINHVLEVVSDVCYTTLLTCERGTTLILQRGILRVQ